MEKYVRKIIKSSTHSYAVTIPKELIERFGWQKKQKVEIIFGGRKPELIVRDWKPKKSRN